MHFSFKVPLGVRAMPAAAQAHGHEWGWEALLAAATAVREAASSGAVVEDP